MAYQSSVSRSILQATQETPIEQAPPPAYGETYGQVDFHQDGFNTEARVANDGRVNININQKSRRLSDLLVPALRSQLNLQQVDELPVPPPGSIPSDFGGLPDQTLPPSLNVVIHVVGSRGDVQPFVALGKVLKTIYGHRVRLATHPTFREFVEQNGLEFFSISGDPAELMAFMVKNPGLMPGMDTLRNGDTGKRRKGIYEIVQGCWRSCFEAGDGTGIKASDHHLDSQSGRDSWTAVDYDLSARPFVADAIIANPPSFAHIHCAEKLGIPLHLMFTMPWSPTQAFPHPLASIHSSNADANLTNFISYALVEMITWQGLGDVINRFRERSLGLEPVSLMWAPGMASRLRIPYTYCWSPALIPKPKDWGPHISVSGFYFLSLAGGFTPEPDLASFLKAGPPPVYIGFGSIVVDDPTAMTKLIFEAVKKSGQRALVSKGWGGLGADTLGIPSGVLMLGNVPHDWLFKHVSCVVHHGGAGTTAAGIALGKPTVIVPFFGDQPFWGAMVAKAGAGPLPIPSTRLTSESLAAAILQALKPSVLRRAEELGASIASERGTDVGAQTFHEKLNIGSLRCTLAPSRTAVWRVKRTNVRLSAFAAAALGNEGLLDFNDLKLYRAREYEIEDGPWDPISGGASALLGTIGSLMMGFVDFPVEILRALRIKGPDQPAPEGITPDDAKSSISGVHTDPVRYSSGPEPSERSSSAENTLSSSRSSTSDENADGTRSDSTTQPNIEGIQNYFKNSSLTSTGTTRMKQSNSSAVTAFHSPQSPLSGLCHRKSASQNSAVSLSRSSSQRSPTHETPPANLSRSSSGNQAGQISLDAALGAGKGIGRIVGAGLKSPMDFTLGIARGFHNAPKLYGDESVRPSEKITGIPSGLKAAGKEFGFGFYDGISGLVTQPLEGAKKEGVAGLIKGFGKGIGGVVLKPGAAIWGLPGYTFKGIYKELQKHLGSSVQNYIIAARTAQGYEALGLSTREERLDIVSRWHASQSELAKGKRQACHTSSFPLSHDNLKSPHRNYDETRKEAGGKESPNRNDEKHLTKGARSQNAILGTPTLVSTPSSESFEFEEAIQDSVIATSLGNAEEDRLIERAIRASVVELQLASKEGNSEDAVQRAIRASVEEAGRVRSEDGAMCEPAFNARDRDRHLEASLQRSMQEPYVNNHEQRQVDTESNDSGIGTDDDENIKTATRNSRFSTIEKPVATSEEDLQRAIQESKKLYEEHEQGRSKARTEEDIVLEYVKKQSVVEEQYRKSVVSSNNLNTNLKPSEDDELRRETH